MVTGATFRCRSSVLSPTEAYTEQMATWRADFFDDWDDSSQPSRSLIISANSDDEVMEDAKAGWVMLCVLNSLPSFLLTDPLFEPF